MPADSTFHRILVIANETCPSTALCSAIAEHLDPAGEVLIVAPALNTRLAHYVSDTDRAVAEAEHRLQQSIENLRRLGLNARGEVGDSNPLTAIGDAMGVFPAEALIIATHSPGDSNWLERGVIERARRRWQMPLFHIVIESLAASP